MRAVPFVAAVVILTPCLAQSASPGQPARVPGPIPELTTEGTFTGTWVYASRDRNIGLWIRLDDDGLPEYRFQVHAVGGKEAFTTDWSGRAEYALAGAPGKFEAIARERDPDRIRGTWEWRVEGSDALRVERGTFDLYRTEDGRQLSLVYPEFERAYREGDREKSWSQPHSIGFVKVSKRLVLWEELPF